MDKTDWYQDALMITELMVDEKGESEILHDAAKISAVAN